MTTEAKFKYALKEMMLSHALESINVTSLCKKCDCHRQTFYYHYQDVYDLLAAIFLNEKIGNLEHATTIQEALNDILDYSMKNFVFLRSTFNSAAKDLSDDFFYSTIMTKVFSLLSVDRKSGLSIDAARTVSRRFARLVSDEFSYCFKDIDITPAAFEKSMSKFIIDSRGVVFPSIVELSKKASK